MKADLTRLTFRQKKDFRKVLMQQGRVQLDSDWNEQLDIQSYLDRSAAGDVIGPCGVPNSGGGFAIASQGNDFSISPGRIYVSGLLVEFQPEPVPFTVVSGKQIKVAIWSPDSRDFAVGQVVIIYDGKTPDVTTSATITVAESSSNTLTLDSIPDVSKYVLPRLRRNATYNYQPYYIDPAPASRDKGVYLAYLDVWERLRTPIEEPRTKEVALGGADTAARTQLVWQVKLWQLPASLVPTPPGPPSCLAVLNSTDWKSFIAAPTAWMTAQSTPQPTSSDPCIVPPQAGYRRLENQLYRVEIHEPGPATTATFKWSRENGSVVTGWNIAKSSPTNLAVASLGRDSVLGFAAGQWVELTDDLHELQNHPGTLVKLNDARMSPDGPILVIPSNTIDFSQFTLNPKIRRWDQADPTQITNNGDILVQEGSPINLEGGAQVIFLPTGTYNTGDYWLVPARTATGDVEWPVDDNGAPLTQPPAGVLHQYCHLALLEFDKGSWTLLEDCREQFPPDAALGMHVTGTNWSNDDTFPIDVITRQGLQITLDNSPDPNSINSSTVIVELEKPVGDPMNQIGEFRIILDGKITTQENLITWIPTSPSFVQLVTGTTQMRIRVTLKGHDIWLQFPATSNIYYLDGQSFGSPGLRSDQKTPRIALTFPTGSGKLASDFDSWLWMMAPAQLAVTGLAVSPATTMSQGTSTGTVTLSAAAPPGGTVVTLASTNPGIAAVPNSVVVPAGATSAPFAITAGRTLGTATITATLGTSSKTATLTVIGLQSISLDPKSVLAGDSAVGTLTFSGPVPANATVGINASPNVVQLVPSSLVVPAGATTGTFQIKVGGKVLDLSGFAVLSTAARTRKSARPRTPAAVTVPSGIPSALPKKAVAKQTSVSISASCGGITVRATLEVVLVLTTGSLQ